MFQPVSITAISSVSPLGSKQQEIWSNYLLPFHSFSKRKTNGSEEYVASLTDEQEEEIIELRKSDKHYKDLDKSVLMAIYTARKAIEKAD